VLEVEQTEDLLNKKNSSYPPQI